MPPEVRTGHAWWHVLQDRDGVLSSHFISAQIQAHEYGLTTRKAPGVPAASISGSCSHARNENPADSVASLPYVLENRLLAPKLQNDKLLS